MVAARRHPGKPSQHAPAQSLAADAHLRLSCVRRTVNIRSFTAVLLPAGLALAVSTCGGRSTLEWGIGGNGGNGGNGGSGGSGGMTTSSGMMSSGIASSGIASSSGVSSSSSGSSSTSSNGGTGGTGGEGGSMTSSASSSSSGSSSSASSSSSSASSSSGGVCAPTCTFDIECQMTCPPPPFGSVCCDFATGLCYLSSFPMCPGMTSSSSSSSSGGY